MPGVTANRLYPFPLIGETVDATSWQNLANAVDADLTLAAALRTDAQRRPLAAVTSISNTQAITVSVLTNITWNTDVAVNPSSMHSTSVNTDQIVVPTPGLYYCALNAEGQGTTTLTAMRLAITVNGTLWESRSNYTASGGVWFASAFGMVICQNAGDIIRAQAKLTGTGTMNVIGASNGSTTNFLVVRMSTL